jgi:hypothetical protein
VCFVELVTQARYSAPGDYGGVTLHTPGPAFGRLDLLGNFVDVSVQRLQQLSRLRRIGVIDHVGIIASTAVGRAPWPTVTELIAWPGDIFQPRCEPCPGNDPAVAY